MGFAGGDFWRSGLIWDRQEDAGGVGIVGFRCRQEVVGEMVFVNVRGRQEVAGGVGVVGVSQHGS
jgi:hypothetical protein